MFLELPWLGRDLFVHLYLFHNGHWLSGVLLYCSFTSFTTRHSTKNAATAASNLLKGKPNPQFQSCWTIDIHAGIGSSVSSVNSIWLAEYYQTLAVISSSRESAQVKSTRMTNNRGVVTKRGTKHGWRKLVSGVQKSYSPRIESTNSCISLILGEICTTFLGERARI